MIKKILSFVGITLGINAILVRVAAAHCPLCTIGAGTAALAASWLGVSSFSIGIFIGAFGLATGLWIGGLLKKKINLFRYQTPIIGIVSLILTVLPLRELFYDNSSIYLSLFGDYGTWLNRTYYVDKFIVGSIVGAVILWIAPYLSKKLSVIRNGRIFPYQGIILSFLLLFIFSVLFEILK
ncbi:MAG: hypothetical protein AAB592_05280 [Patescibacteria group bacterium]